MKGRGVPPFADYCGDTIRPFSWKEIDAKFDKLTAVNATETSRQKIKDAVRSLEEIQFGDLMEGLSLV